MTGMNIVSYFPESLPLSFERGGGCRGISSFPPSTLLSESRFLLTVLIIVLASQIHAESVSLEELLQKTRAMFMWDALGHKGQFSRDGNTVVFRVDDPWMVLNGRQLLPTGTVIEEQGRLIFSQEAADTLYRVFGIQKSFSSYRLKTILLDPGHGGRDSGAIRHWKTDGVEIPIAEKDVVLEISLQLASKLKRLYPKKSILLTRSRDVYPTLEERVNMANRIELAPREGMLYISIHANASLNSKAEGYEVWYLPKNYRRNVVDTSSFAGNSSIAPIINTLWEEEFTHESIRLADMILDNFQRQLGPGVPNRGRREESWFVVRNAKMASVLLEVGFITNPSEAARLRQPEYLQRITLAIYNGIHEFVDYFERKGN